MIRVILCDDHAVVRRGIRDTLTEAVDIQYVAETGSYSEVRDALRTTAWSSHRMTRINRRPLWDRRWWPAPAEPRE